MLKPDVAFTIIVNPIAYVIGCEEKKAKESQGNFGFHPWNKCPNCQVISKGYQFWGENGHMQGSADNRERMILWVSRKIREQWRSKDGKLIGYRFQLGERIYYQG